MPSASHSLAYTLVGVKPGIVLSSLTRTVSPSTKKSTRARSAQPQNSKAVECEPLHRGGGARRDPRRQPQRHSARLVLGLVVVEIGFDDDLAGLRRACALRALKDGALDLDARCARLDDRELVVGQCRLDRVLQLAPGLLDLADAHRRSHSRRLDEQRAAQRGDQLDRSRSAARLELAPGERARVDLRHTDGIHQALEAHLVHAQGGGRDTGADIGDVEALEQALHRAVLAVGAVERREHDVAVEQTAPRGQGELAAVAEPAAVARYLDRHDRVPRRREAFAHRGGRHERDRVLSRPAAPEDGDAHQLVPLTPVLLGPL